MCGTEWQAGELFLKTPCGYDRLCRAEQAQSFLICTLVREKLGTVLSFHGGITTVPLQ